MFAVYATVVAAKMLALMKIPDKQPVYLSLYLLARTDLLRNGL